MKVTKEAIAHLKTHVKYPASKADILAQCSNMSDTTAEDRKAAQKLPDKKFANFGEVMKALSA